MNNNTNYDPEKAIKEYYDFMNNPGPEVIARFGGEKAYRKHIRKFKRHEMWLAVKSCIRSLPSYAFTYLFWIPVIFLVTVFLKNIVVEFQDISMKWVLIIGFLVHIVYREIDYRIYLKNYHKRKK